MRAGGGFIFKLISTVPATGTIPEIPRGTLGYGILAVAEHAGSNGKFGRLVWEPRYLQLPDGTHFPVMADPALADGFAQGASNSIPEGFGLVPLLGIAIGGYNALHRGKEIVIPRGTPMRLIIGDDIVEGRCVDPPASDL